MLALDGLEFTLVKKWGLNYLMQEYSGVFKIPKEYFITCLNRWTGNKVMSSPFTPIIWTSFLTGRKPEEHGIKTLRTYLKIPEILRYSKIVHKTKKIVDHALGLSLGKILGITPPFLIDKRDIPYPTIFDVIENSIAIYFICYNEPSWVFNTIATTLKHDLSKASEALWCIYKLRKKEMFKRLNDDWQLFGVYFEIADILGHLYMGKRSLKLLKVYLELNKLIREIKELLPNDVAFLVVTDHGMKPSPNGVGGIHSEYAFWSTNVKLSSNPKDFTHFFYLILKLLSS